MFFIGCQALVVFTACLLGRTLVYSIHRCGQDLCRDDQVCCAHGNTTTCCTQFVDQTYYNIAMVTRKLSGVLIMLLLFAVGYFVQRVLCSRSRQHIPPPPHGPPSAAASQEMLMESCTRDSLEDAAAQLPTYDDCKRLPTYEETVRGDRGLSESTMGQTT